MIARYRRRESKNAHTATDLVSGQIVDVDTTEDVAANGPSSPNYRADVVRSLDTTSTSTSSGGSPRGRTKRERSQTDLSVVQKSQRDIKASMRTRASSSPIPVFGAMLGPQRTRAQTDALLAAAQLRPTWRGRIDESAHDKASRISTEYESLADEK